MGRIPERWLLAALLVTSACDLNPRPEDPGAGADKGSNGGEFGTGGASSVPPAPSEGAAGTMSIPGGVTGSPSSQDGGFAPGADGSADAGASDAGASDARADAGAAVAADDAHQ